MKIPKENKMLQDPNSLMGLLTHILELLGGL